MAAPTPTGMVTFLFADLEGDTSCSAAHPAAYGEALRRHHALLRGAVEAHGGVVVETVGDAVYAALLRRPRTLWRRASRPRCKTVIARARPPDEAVNGAALGALPWARRAG